MIGIVSISALVALIINITTMGQVYDHLDRGLDAIDEGEVAVVIYSRGTKCLRRGCPLPHLFDHLKVRLQRPRPSSHVSLPFRAASAVIAAKDNTLLADRIENLRVQVTGSRAGGCGFVQKESNDHKCCYLSSRPD